MTAVGSTTASTNVFFEAGNSEAQQSSSGQEKAAEVFNTIANSNKTEQPIDAPQVGNKVVPLAASSTDRLATSSTSTNALSSSTQNEQEETTLTPCSSPAQKNESQQMETSTQAFHIARIPVEQEEEEEENSHLEPLKASDSGYDADSPVQEEFVAHMQQFSAPSRAQSDADATTGNGTLNQELAGAEEKQPFDTSVPLSTTPFTIPTSSTAGLTSLTQTPSDKTSLPPPPETQVNGVPPSTSPQIGASTPRSMLPKMSSEAPEEPSDWKKTAAIVTLIVTGVIAAFAVLCVMKIFPPAFLGGQIGTCCTLAASGLFVIGSGILLWVRLRSKPVENA